MIYLDDTLLFLKENNSWKYISELDGVLVHNSMSFFPDNCVKIFADDIINQLENGVDRNQLNINIPKEIKTFKIGDNLFNTEQ